MAAPMSGISAGQVAQQKLQDQGAQQTNKTGASKFDGVLADKAQGADKADAAQGVKSGGMVSDLVSGLEKGQVSMDKLIKEASSGKNMSNAELLGLQASMYKYSQELDLTSKVVEKATSGLKDVVKTQV
ncbi:MAG: ATP-dependent helicase HrpB [Myxococcaceae bacterium]|nr:MAG: ATP-dependent helicase HrpB [Myxococcaceae bacterium]